MAAVPARRQPPHLIGALKRCLSPCTASQCFAEDILLFDMSEATEHRELIARSSAMFREELSLSVRAVVHSVDTSQSLLFG